MFKYNNSHIFTGYLKQLLASFNLPACRIYTSEFAKYLEQHGKEDPRVLESFDDINENRLATRINYLKNNGIYNYFWKRPRGQDLSKAYWRRSTDLYYSEDKVVPGLTRSLNSPGIYYDTKTHEYLGDYLRFLRDYHNINLMSLYNCFNDKICNNIYYAHKINVLNNNYDKSRASGIDNPEYLSYYKIFDSQDSNYRIYAIPVKLFSEYTIAIDCDQGIELFCGLYNTNLDLSSKAENLASKTYKKVNKTLFSQPFLYDSLSVNNWLPENDFTTTDGVKTIRTDVYTRWDIANREKDLRLFIKIPVSCRSTITILEGDFRYFNDTKYAPENEKLVYQRNHSILNFNSKGRDKVDLNNYAFKPISKLQLLAINTGESYPFADRLVEYLSGSAITPIDEISDNIKRVQKVMCQNNNYFNIEGIWENKMQNILYDYVVNSGSVKLDKTTDKLKDERLGYHPRQGYATKSTMYDILGYVDKDTEKLYASWKKENNTAKIGTSLQTVDIYDNLYNI